MHIENNISVQYNMYICWYTGSVLVFVPIKSVVNENIKQIANGKHVCVDSKQITAGT